MLLRRNLPSELQAADERLDGIKSVLHALVSLDVQNLIVAYEESKFLLYQDEQQCHRDPLYVPMLNRGGFLYLPLSEPFLVATQNFENIRLCDVNSKPLRYLQALGKAVGKAADKLFTISAKTTVRKCYMCPEWTDRSCLSCGLPLCSIPCEERSRSRGVAREWWHSDRKVEYTSHRIWLSVSETAAARFITHT
jgi:hypothetical protein